MHVSGLVVAASLAAACVTSTGAPVTTPEPTACPPAPHDVQPWAASATADAVELGDGVRAVVYPGPSESGNPWSQWGQGIVLDDGRFLSAVGDHLGAEGNSYLYEFDPGPGTLTMIADVASLVDQPAGTWGYGKIHAPLVAGPCGEVYAATYWGTRRDLRYDDHYRGDLLLQLDPDARTVGVAGVPVPEHGLPSMAASGPTLFFEAPTPESDPDAGAFVAYDLLTRESAVVDDDSHVGFRTIGVDAEGRALYTAPEGRLTRFDPADGSTTVLDDPLPGAFLRAVSAPAPDGTLYGFTQDPAHFLTIRADGSLVDGGEAPGYTTSVAMTPDGATVYFVPGAHGDAWESGTPLMAWDTASGEVRTVAELNALTERELGLTAGGTYDLALDAERGRLFVGLNAAPVAEREDTTFGEVVLLELDLARLDAGARPAGDAPASTAGASPAPEPTAGPADATAAADGTCRAVAPAEDGPAAWVDVTAESGLEAALTGMMGHAAAWGDLDGDDRVDLLVGTFADRDPAQYQQRGAAGPRPDRLLTGGDAGTFAASDLPLDPGRTSGAVFADLDLDGDLDAVVARNVRNALPTPTAVMVNDDGELTEVADAGLDPASPGRSIGVLRVDDDELPDLIILEDRFRGGHSRLYRNLGELRFEPMEWPDDVHGLGIATGDLTGDGITDVVIGGSNRVFVGTGTALDEVPDALPPWPTAGDEDDAAGVDLGDVDGDGDLDVVIGQHDNSTIDTERPAPVRLFLNETVGGHLRLRDVTNEAGLVPLPTKAPHVALVDLDNDGRLDLLTSAASGDQPVVFMNVGEDEARFQVEEPIEDSDRYWVSAPTADVDRDGRLDVVLVEWDPARPTRLLVNRRSAGHFLDIAVDHTLGGGPGTVVAAYEPGGAGRADALVARAEISVSQGFGGGVEAVAHLGLGERTAVDVVVTPPAPAAPITLTGVGADQRLRLPGCGPSRRPDHG